MKFLKNELEFLNLYNLCRNNNEELSQKLNIVANSENNKVTFSQLGIKLCLKTELKKDVSEDFNLTVSTEKLFNLLKISKEDEIEINKKGIDFSTGHYTFGSVENDDLDIDSLNDRINKECLNT